MNRAPYLATTAILDFAFAGHVLPVSVRADALHFLSDTLAVGAAGAVSSEAKQLLCTIRGWGAAKEARIIGCEERLPASSAAFINGFAIHCLEWDAVHEPAVVHALSVVSAALLAASDRMGGSDQDAFLNALAVGVDIASGIGLSATGPMRFFRPATAGIIGAALAVARLQGLERSKYGDVLGLAYSFTSGTMQAHVEASIALPLQIANAARSALNAVDLAIVGMDGPHDALEGPFGYSALIEPLDLTRYTGKIGQVWQIGRVSIKPFPSGRASHGALGAISNLLADGGVDAASVTGATLHAPPLIQRLVGRPYKQDMTPAYARLCFPFLLPLMLRDGHIDPRCFDVAGMADPALSSLAEKVEVVLDDNPDSNALGPQRLTVNLSDGSRIEHVINENLGSPAAPMLDTQSADKYELCRVLAGHACDRRIFDDPLSYTTEPL